MSDKDDSEQVARLERLNEELSNSLQRCRDLLHGYEARLAANSNEAATTDADDGEQDMRRLEAERDKR